MEHLSLKLVASAAMEHLSLKHAARERALPKSRAAIRYCANSIRATHRQEFRVAEELASQAYALLVEMSNDLRDYQDVFYAGFVQDAQKEYAEAVTFAALVQHRPLPTASQLSIGWAAYLNGLGETVGELRRYILDQLRHATIESESESNTCHPERSEGSGTIESESESNACHPERSEGSGTIENCESLLDHMDDIYALLTTIDFPDALTSGLRRTTDAARGVLEKTRADLTTAVGQAQLQHTMRALQQQLHHPLPPIAG
jgi:translin